VLKCKNQWRIKSGNNNSEIWSLNFEVWSPRSEVWSLKIPLAFAQVTQDKEKAKGKKTDTMYVGRHYPQANTNNVNKTWSLLQTTGGRDEPNIVGMLNSQHGTQSKRHIIGEHKKLKRWGTRILMTGKSYVKALHLRVQSVFINFDGNLTALFNQIKTNLNKC
jgi:hypothetical protein